MEAIGWRAREKMTRVIAETDTSELCRRVGGLDTPARLLHPQLVTQACSSRKSVFAPEAFSCLMEAHPPYPEQSPSFKTSCSQVSVTTTSRQCLNSDPVLKLRLHGTFDHHRSIPRFLCVKEVKLRACDDCLGLEGKY